MKNAKMFTITVLALGLVAWQDKVSNAEPMGTAWTYQGRLMDANSTADGLYDFQFKLFDGPNTTTAEQMGGTIYVNDMDVIEGYFTVELDFGNVFSGDARWLQTGVRPGDSNDFYTTLNPAQAITPAPYAIYAQIAGGDNDWMVVGNYMYSIPSGNVGIGTTTPGAKLDIDGDVSTSSVYRIGGDTVLSVAGTRNILVGVGAGANNMGTGATLVGYNAGYHNQYESNTFLGCNAGYNNTEGYLDTFVGHGAGYDNTLGAENTFIGAGAGHSNTTGHYNTFVGFTAGFQSTRGKFNTFLGHTAGYHNTSAAGNTFVGKDAGFSNTTGDDNTFVGYGAGRSNTTTAGNTFLGKNAGYSNTTGDENIFLGYEAGLSNTTGGGNTFLGYGAGRANTSAAGNTFVGAAAGPYNTTGTGNSFLGTTAGFSNTTGYRNTFFGAAAGYENTTGNDNTFVGVRAGHDNTTGTGNVFIGYKAGENENVSNKLYIANGPTDANVLIYGDFSTGRIGIGTNDPTYKLQIEGGANPLQITGGGPQYKKFRFDIETGGYSVFRMFDNNTSEDFRLATNGDSWLRGPGNVGIGTTSPSSKLHVAGGCITGSMCSDIRLKKNIEPLPADDSILDRVMGLKAVTFEWKHREDGKRQIGLVAQDVEKVFPEVVTTPDDGTCQKGLLATGLDAVLIEGIKELKVENELLKDRIEALERTINLLAKAKEFEL